MNDQLPGGGNQGDEGGKAGDDGKQPNAGAGGGGEAPEFDVSTLSEDQQQLFAAKKWGNLDDVFSSYTNLEKRIGADTIVAPVQGETIKFFGENKEAVGVPEAADGYQFEAPEMPDGMEWDKELEDKARAFAHERNIPNDIFREFMDFTAQSRIGEFKATTDFAAQDEQKTTAVLQKDWGKNYEQNTQIAQAAVQAIGLDDDTVAAINDKIDSPVMLKLFHQLGTMMAEDQLTGGMAGGSGFAGTVGAAKAEIATLKQSNDFMANLNNKSAAGHKEALDKWERLHKTAFPAS